MELEILIPSFLILSMAGTTLSLAVYSNLEENNKSPFWILIGSLFFLVSFIVALHSAFSHIKNLDMELVLFLVFSFIAVVWIMIFIGNRFFVEFRLFLDEKSKPKKIVDDNLEELRNILQP